jgi:hypothetical protein
MKINTYVPCVVYTVRNNSITASSFRHVRACLNEETDKSGLTIKQCRSLCQCLFTVLTLLEPK